jgi:hypothetical protein
MKSIGRNAQLCEACGRELEASQDRFCTDMCRFAFQEVFADESAHAYLFSDDDVLAAAEQAELEEHKRLSLRFEDDPPLGIALLDEDDEDDYDILDDLDDDEDDDLDLDDDEDDDEDDVDDDLIDAEEGEDLLPEAFVRPTLSPAVTSSSVLSSGALRDVIEWERVPEMEDYVGIRVERATCRCSALPEGDFEIGIVAELSRLPDAKVSLDTRHRLTALAEESSEFLGVERVSIPPRREFPPLSIAYLRFRVAACPERLRLYPEP